MEIDISPRVRIMMRRLNYANFRIPRNMREMRYYPTRATTYGKRYDYQKNDFARQLKRLQEVSPYLRSLSVHFYRNVTRTGIVDITDLCREVDAAWVSLMPEALAEHEFESAQQAAFAINLKNIYDNQTQEQYLLDERLADVWFLPRGFDQLVNVCDGINYSFMDVGRVIREGDYPFMRMLVKYGVVRPALQKSSIYILKDYILWLAQTDQTLGLEHLHIVDGAKKAAHRLLTYDEIKDWDCEAKLVRLQTVANAIQVLNEPDPDSQKPKKAENILACIRLYFEAVPEPFVSLLEIYRLLESAHETKEHYSMSRKVESFNRYRDVFPECDGHQPRTLMHLSRCVLREGLCKRGQLPVVISRLPVPQSIKDYIQIV